MKMMMVLLSLEWKDVIASNSHIRKHAILSKDLKLMKKYRISLIRSEAYIY